MLTVGTPQSRSLEVRLSRDRAILTLVLRGRLDMKTSGHVWREALRILERVKPMEMVLDAAEVSYCDGAGVALIVKLQQHMAHLGREVSLHGLPVKFRSLLDIYGQASREPVPEPVHAPLSVVEQIGHAGLGIWQDLRILVTFVGELSVGVLDAAMHPHRIRWKEVWLTAERAGVNALPIIALIGFLLGLIMAFQAAIPMRQFGAEIFVANLIGLSMLRELGPLITAILLAGRSASAFAAELGTMKVREEIDALTTMGLDPLRFLAVPRVIAAVAMTPLLAVFANLFGLIGGAVVMRSLGFTFTTYVNQILLVTHLGDLLGGLLKSVVFGLLVAAIGCLRGLQTKTGASAVGISTTQAVVSGIVLIAIADGIFAVAFYYLGI